PLPVVGDHLLERVLEIAHELGVDALVDRDAGGRVRHVDERGRRAVRLPERIAYEVGDLDQLRPAVRLQGDLVHAVILGPAVAEPLSERQLDSLRADADRFIAELDEEAYLHFAGHKDTYDLVPIYERHAELTTLDTALRIGASVNGGRNTRELWRFACEGYLGNFVREEAERIAELEAGLKAEVDGDEIPYRNIRPAIANEET